MPHAWILIVALMTALASPLPVAMRFRMQREGATPEDVARITAALRRGLYDDTLLVFPADSLLTRQSLVSRDSASSARRAQGFRMDGVVVARGDALEIRLRLLNILMQPVARPDTIRIRRSQIDSALANTGHRYAESLARRFGSRLPNGP